MNDREKILLIKRANDDSNNPALWEAPGGKLDTGQDLTHALEREVLEETGLVVDPSLYPLFADSFVIGEGKYQGLTYLVLFGVCSLVGGKLRLSAEHSDSKWLTPDEAVELELTPETHKAMVVLKEHLPR